MGQVPDLPCDLSGRQVGDLPHTNMTTFSVLLGVTLLLWVAMLKSFNHPVTAHDFGPAILSVLLALVVWGLLAALLFMGASKGEMPKWAKVLAWILQPASFAAAIVAADGNSTPNVSNRLLFLVPVLAPLMMAAYASWAYFPSFRAAIPAVAAGSSAWGVVFVLVAVPWAMMTLESSAREAGMAEAQAQAEIYEGKEHRAGSLERLQRLTPDSPLWDWLDLAAPRDGVREEALAGARALKHRQADADVMLAHGAPGFMKELPYLDLEPTPTIIAGHKKYLLDMARGLERDDAGSVKYSWVASQVDPYLGTIQWMAERRCGCSAEMAAVEAAVRLYKRSPGKAECLAALAKAQATEKK